MTDPRIELTGLTNGPAGSEVLDRLDGLQIVLTVAEGRGASREDAAGLVNLINIGARIFPHWEVRVGDDVPVELGVFGHGALGELLRQTRDRAATEATRAPERQIVLCWGATPDADGLALDAAGWSCSLGPQHLALREQAGPALGALAVGCWAIGQLLVEALAPLGLPGHRTEGFRWNLLTYELAEAPAGYDGSLILPAFTNAGCGSVGSSLLYVALLAGAVGGPVDLVDPDLFSPRNRLRYPILQEILDEVAKVSWLAELCRRGGIAAQAHRADLVRYINSFPAPPVIDLAVVSVDSMEGRRDATDMLAATTLNIGVGGLALHISRHSFGETGCAYCQYVDLTPALSGAEMLAEVIGLPVARIIALEQGDGRLSEADAKHLAAGGRYGDRPPAAGQRLADVRRRAYAQASVPTADGNDLRVSAPHVSALAGILGLAEVVKHRDPALADHRLAGRVDFDLSGQPAGFTVVAPVDPSGRCLCHSGFRRRAWAKLHVRAGRFDRSAESAPVMGARAGHDPVGP